MRSSTFSRLRGFTLVELIITLVIIGILAGIAWISYSALQKRAEVGSIQTTAQSIDHEAVALAASSNLPLGDGATADAFVKTSLNAADAAVDTLAGPWHVGTVTISQATAGEPYAFIHSATAGSPCVLYTPATTTVGAANAPTAYAAGEVAVDGSCTADGQPADNGGGNNPPGGAPAAPQGLAASFDGVNATVTWTDVPGFAGTYEYSLDNVAWAPITNGGTVAATEGATLRIRAGANGAVATTPLSAVPANVGPVAWSAAGGDMPLMTNFLVPVNDCTGPDASWLSTFCQWNNGYNPTIGIKTTGFAVGETVNVTMDGQPFGSFTGNGDTAVWEPLTNTITAGSHAFVLTGQTSGYVLAHVMTGYVPPVGVPVVSYSNDGVTITVDSVSAPASGNPAVFVQDKQLSFRVDGADILTLDNVTLPLSVPTVRTQDDVIAECDATAPGDPFCYDNPQMSGLQPAYDLSGLTSVHATVLYGAGESPWIAGMAALSSNP